MIKVTVWNEYVNQDTPEILAHYPDGMHNTIKSFLDTDSELFVRTATMDMPDHGLSKEVLDDTDVLIWWGHLEHDKVSDDVANYVIQRVHRGMGIIFLHSSHQSKPFKGLIGTSGHLTWREGEEKERIWTIRPEHPIAQGVPSNFVLMHEETYGERFDIPEPDALIFISWFAGGEVFRSGCEFVRGYGKIFYFQPGHETHPTFLDKNIQKVINNAVHHLAPRIMRADYDCPNVEAPERK